MNINLIKDNKCYLKTQYNPLWLFEDDLQRDDDTLKLQLDIYSLDDYFAPFGLKIPTTTTADYLQIYLKLHADFRPDNPTFLWRLERSYVTDWTPTVSTATPTIEHRALTINGSTDSYVYMYTGSLGSQQPNFFYLDFRIAKRPGA